MNDTQRAAVQPPVVPDDHGLVPLLPRGRWTMTAAELASIAVEAFPASRRRPVLWARLERARRVLAPLMREIWVGGSFMSTKREPKDIDVMVVLRLGRLRVPNSRRDRDWFLTNAAYALGYPLELDLKLTVEGDLEGQALWQRWIEYGKPYVRARYGTPDRGIAVLRMPA